MSHPASSFSLIFELMFSKVYSLDAFSKPSVTITNTLFSSVDSSMFSRSWIASPIASNKGVPPRGCKRSFGKDFNFLTETLEIGISIDIESKVLSVREALILFSF